MNSMSMNFSPHYHYRCDWITDFYNQRLRDALQQIIDPINNQIKDAGTSLTQSPADFFGSQNWNNVQNICIAVILPIALTILSFCLAFELYHIAERNNGSLDLEQVGMTLLKFIFPFFMISNCYGIMQSICIMMNGALKTLFQKLSYSPAQFALQIDDIMAAYQKQSGWGQAGFFTQIMSTVGLVALFMQILSIAIYFVIVGRVFEIAIMWLLSPIPTAFLVNTEERRVGISFYKQFFAVMLQGFLILIVLFLYSFLVKNFYQNAGGGTGDPQKMIWNMVGMSFVLVGVLVGTGKLARSLVNAV